MALVRSFYAELLQNMSSLFICVTVVLVSMRSPSCIPSSSLMFSKFIVSSLPCNVVMYYISAANSVFSAKTPMTWDILRTIDCRVNYLVSTKVLMKKASTKCTNVRKIIWALLSV